MTPPHRSRPSVERGWDIVAAAALASMLTLAIAAALVLILYYFGQ